MIESKVKILLVEDHAFTRDLVTKILAKQGFDYVIEAKNAKLGLEKVQSETPDLVLLDINMPGMDGLEMTKRIRALPNPKLANTPIVILTGQADKSHVLKAREAGANLFVAKPISPKVLAERIAAVLSEATASSSALPASSES